MCSNWSADVHLHRVLEAKKRARHYNALQREDNSGYLPVVLVTGVLAATVAWRLNGPELKEQALQLRKDWDVKKVPYVGGWLHDHLSFLRRKDCTANKAGAAAQKRADKAKAFNNTPAVGGKANPPKATSSVTLRANPTFEGKPVTSQAAPKPKADVKLEANAKPATSQAAPKPKADVKLEADVKPAAELPVATQPKSHDKPPPSPQAKPALEEKAAAPSSEKPVEVEVPAAEAKENAAPTPPEKAAPNKAEKEPVAAVEEEQQQPDASLQEDIAAAEEKVAAPLEEAKPGAGLMEAPVVTPEHTPTIITPKPEALTAAEVKPKAVPKESAVASLAREPAVSASLPSKSKAKRDKKKKAAAAREAEGAHAAGKADGAHGVAVDAGKPPVPKKEEKRRSEPLGAKEEAESKRVKLGANGEGGDQTTESKPLPKKPLSFTTPAAGLETKPSPFSDSQESLDEMVALAEEREREAKQKGLSALPLSLENAAAKAARQKSFVKEASAQFGFAKLGLVPKEVESSAAAEGSGLPALTVPEETEATTGESAAPETEEATRDAHQPLKLSLGKPSDEGTVSVSLH